MCCWTGSKAVVMHPFLYITEIDKLNQVYLMVSQSLSLKNIRSSTPVMRASRSTRRSSNGLRRTRNKPLSEYMECSTECFSKIILMACTTSRDSVHIHRHYLNNCGNSWPDHVMNLPVAKLIIGTVRFAIWMYNFLENGCVSLPNLGSCPFVAHRFVIWPLWTHSVELMNVNCERRLSIIFQAPQSIRGLARNLKTYTFW